MKCPKCGYDIAFEVQDKNGKRFLIDDVGNWLDDIDEGAEVCELTIQDNCVCNECGYEGKIAEFDNEEVF